MGLRVGLTFDLKGDYLFREGDPPDANAEFDHEDTIHDIEEALQAGRHEVVRLGNARALLERREELKRLDIVFNLAEGYVGRNRESEVPVILEMLGVPFVGSDGLTMALTLDKLVAKKVLIAEGIPTPRFVELQKPEEAATVQLKYPLIAKLRHEGCSKGLTIASLVKNTEELELQVERLTRTYQQPALIEEFIEGREFTVGIIGNDPPEAQPIVQIEFDGQLEHEQLFYTFEQIQSANYVCPAPIEEALEQRLASLALQTYTAVGCRDFGRVDFRVDAKGTAYVLELNPLPSLSTEDAFWYFARARGTSFQEIVNQILDSALVRYRMVKK
jgi:D-alanine-D-alanine ligase